MSSKTKEKTLIIDFSNSNLNFANFQPQMSTDASAFQAYIFTANVHAIITSFFALFCIFVILHYSTKAIENEYRFHLINMAISILICDLSLCYIIRPIPQLPMNAMCYIGELNDYLLSRLDLQRVFDVEMVRRIEFYFM
jgi:hypothetical protein